LLKKNGMEKRIRRKDLYRRFSGYGNGILNNYLKERKD
jgi:hypothetical protein